MEVKGSLCENISRVQNKSESKIKSKSHGFETTLTVMGKKSPLLQFYVFIYQNLNSNCMVLTTVKKRLMSLQSLKDELATRYY